jgi:Arm DNA-binding domain
MQTDKIYEYAAYADEQGGPGGSLFLQITPARSRSWTFRFSSSGKMREFGLGPYPLVSLSMARKAADHVRLQVRQCVDPIAERMVARDARCRAGNLCFSPALRPQAFDPQGVNSSGSFHLGGFAKSRRPSSVSFTLCNPWISIHPRS